MEKFIFKQLSLNWIIINKILLGHIPSLGYFLESFSNSRNSRVAMFMYWYRYPGVKYQRILLVAGVESLNFLPVPLCDYNRTILLLLSISRFIISMTLNDFQAGYIYVCMATIFSFSKDTQVPWERSIQNYTLIKTAATN